MANTAVSAPDFREERDRFVAFVFASADAFLELDEEFNVDYAVGAVQSLYGTSQDLIIGKPLIEFVHPPDRTMVRAALGGVKRQGRFGPLSVRFTRGDSTPVKTAMFGSYLPTHEGRIYVALSALRMSPGSTVDESSIDPETGLLNKDSFSDIAAEALKAGKEEGRDYNMTLLDLDGLEEVKARLGAEEAEEFVATVTAEL
jgi:PAS domain S-box-containing protein